MKKTLLSLSLLSSFSVAASQCENQDEFFIFQMSDGSQISVEVPDQEGRTQIHSMLVPKGFSNGVTALSVCTPRGFDTVKNKSASVSDILPSGTMSNAANTPDANKEPGNFAQLVGLQDDVQSIIYYPNLYHTSLFVDSYYTWAKRVEQGNKGDKYLYANPYNDKVEIWELKKNGKYNYFPTNQVSNDEWEFVEEVTVTEVAPIDVALVDAAYERAGTNYQHERFRNMELSSAQLIDTLEVKPRTTYAGYVLEYKFKPTVNGANVSRVEVFEQRVDTGETSPIFSAWSEYSDDIQEVKVTSTYKDGPYVQVMVRAFYDDGNVRLFRSQEVKLAEEN